jgi:hypothetical protein
MKRILLSFVLILNGCGAAFAINCPSLPYTLTNGTTADANQVMANFNTIMSCLASSGGGGGGGGANAAPQGRLTLQSHTPVMTTSQTGKQAIYYDCYVGNQVPYFNGTADALGTIAVCEAGITLEASGTGVINSGGVFDVWWAPNGANQICIATNGSGGGWASDAGGSNSARGTGYSQIDNTTRPYLTNKNILSHCYNGTSDYGPISANQATYLGTVATDAGSPGQVSYTFGSSAAGGGTARFGVWNAYNRVIAATNVQDNSSWAVTSTSWQPYDAGGTGGGLNNRVTYVVGLAEDGVSAVGRSLGTNGSGGQVAYGLGIDSTSALSGGGGYGTGGTSVNTVLVANYSGVPGLGLHYVQELQIVQSGSSTLWGAVGTDTNALTVSLRN